MSRIHVMLCGFKTFYKIIMGYIVLCNVMSDVLRLQTGRQDQTYTNDSDHLCKTIFR